MLGILFFCFFCALLFLYIVHIFFCCAMCGDIKTPHLPARRRLTCARAHLFDSISFVLSNSSHLVVASARHLYMLIQIYSQCMPFVFICMCFVSSFIFRFGNLIIEIVYHTDKARRQFSILYFLHLSYFYFLFVSCFFYYCLFTRLLYRYRFALFLFSFYAITVSFISFSFMSLCNNVLRYSFLFFYLPISLRTFIDIDFFLRLMST